VTITAASDGVDSVTAAAVTDGTLTTARGTTGYTAARRFMCRAARSR
jgi:hypothetical protein